MKSKVFIKKMSTYWSLTSKIFTFVYFPFGKCESAPSLNNPVVQEKGQWFATGARHLFELRLALNFIGQCALYYPAPPSLPEAATHSFPLWGFSGPTMETWGDPTTHHCTSQAEQLQSWGENICVLWTLETQWTQDTRPNPPQLFIDCLQKWSEKDLNSGWGISTDTHTLPNIVPLNNKKVNERQGQVPTSKMLIFVLQVCKASACVCIFLVQTKW